MQKTKVIALFIIVCVLSVVMSEALFQDEASIDTIATRPLTISIEHSDFVLSSSLKLTLQQADSPSHLVFGLAKAFHVQTQLWSTAAVTAISQAPQLILDLCRDVTDSLVNF